MIKCHVITTDHHKIYYDYYKNNHRKLVVIAHGFFNSKNSVLLKDLARELNKQYDVAVLDFRGHGDSPGLFSWTTKEYLDLEAVLKKFRHDYDKIGVVGFSLGAATSLITAARGNFIDSVIAVSPPTEFEKIEFHFWDLDFENDIIFNFKEGRKGKGVRPGPFWHKKDKPINIVPKIEIPVLYIHGEADWLIRPWHSQALFDKTKSKRKIVLIKKGPHAEYLIRKNKTETLKVIGEWFEDTL